MGKGNMHQLSQTTHLALSSQLSTGGPSNRSEDRKKTDILSEVLHNLIKGLSHQIILLNHYETILFVVYVYENIMYTIY